MVFSWILKRVQDDNLERLRKWIHLLLVPGIVLSRESLKILLLGGVGILPKKMELLPIPIDFIKPSGICPVGHLRGLCIKVIASPVSNGYF